MKNRPCTACCICFWSILAVQEAALTQGEGTGRFEARGLGEVINSWGSFEESLISLISDD